MRSLQHVFRRLGRTPAFTAIALVTLALGIGATTAIFSVINGVLIKPLPFPQSQDLVAVGHLAPGIPSIGGTLNCSPTMYFTYREENQTFQDFGLWSNGGGTITGVGDPEALRAIIVTDGVLEALGVQPAVGRWFTRG
jgi:putative ABC transport system permease protein